MKISVKMIFFLLISLCLWSSCQEETLLETTQDVKEYDSSKVSEPVKDLSFDLEVSNGRLVFTDLQHFMSTLEFLSDNENRHFTREALDNWEQQIGFKSSRNEYEEILDEYEKITSEEELRIFKNNVDEKITFDKDDFPVSNVGGIVTYVLENKYSSCIIGDYIHVFKDGLQIVFPIDRIGEIESIINNPIENESEGILVNKMTVEENFSYRMCGNNLSFSCEDESNNGKRRINTLWQLQIYVSPSTDATLVLELEIQSRRKKPWWRKNYDDDIEFGIGYGVAFTYTENPNCNTDFVHPDLNVCGGTGWTQNSWRITHIRPLHSIPGIHNARCYLDLRFLYNFNFAQNNDHPTCECNGNASDDCSNPGEGCN